MATLTAPVVSRFGATGAPFERSAGRDHKVPTPAVGGGCPRSAAALCCAWDRRGRKPRAAALPSDNILGRSDLKSLHRSDFAALRAAGPHSISIVPGGFEVTSYITRLTPWTSLMIRVAVSERNSWLNG